MSILNRFSITHVTIAYVTLYSFSEVAVVTTGKNLLISNMVFTIFTSVVFTRCGLSEVAEERNYMEL